ncbi:hypothetical protein ACIBHY_03310 [Nonomuraea sp. NPDC050547]|uniref:hypothetical protein n=1 Tax=Nonomuraea sp. NPDC050547 TaxID=3364368 RepID=UPI00378952A6
MGAPAVHVAWGTSMGGFLPQALLRAIPGRIATCSPSSAGRRPRPPPPGTRRRPPGPDEYTLVVAAFLRACRA